MRYNAAIFDFDGTLADTSEDVWTSVQYAAEQLGGALDPLFKKVPSHLTAPLEEIFRAVRPPLSVELLDAFQREIKRHYREINTYPATELYPGISALLQRMKEEHIPRFIVSAKPLYSLERILRLKRWDDYFMGWYSQETEQGDRISKKDLILKLLRDPLAGYAAVYIGDTCSDVIAARESGIDCIGAAYGDGDKELLLAERPASVVWQASDLENFFIRAGA